MALPEQIATLLGANLNDMIDRAEDPVRMMNQVVVDLEDQLLQMKTQVAIEVADHHLLEKKREENRARETEWAREAEIALQMKDEERARTALQQSLESREAAKSLDERIAVQRVQVENMNAALHKLDAKLAEARSQRESLAERNRRGRAANPARSAAFSEIAATTQIITRANEVIGDKQSALRWLGTPARALNYATPISMLGDEDGRKVVEQLLGRIEHGVW